MAKSEAQKFTELRGKMSEVCVLLYKDDQKVGQIIGKWYHSQGTLNLKMGIKLWGTVPALEGGHTDWYVSTARLGGGGYNKYREGMERLLRGAENWIEKNFGVTLRVEKMLTYDPDKEIPWRDWFNHWDDILKEAGFTVIVGL